MVRHKLRGKNCIVDLGMTMEKPTGENKSPKPRTNLRIPHLLLERLRWKNKDRVGVLIDFPSRISDGVESLTLVNVSKHKRFAKKVEHQTSKYLDMDTNTTAGQFKQILAAARRMLTKKPTRHKVKVALNYLHKHLILPSGFHFIYMAKRHEKFILQSPSFWNAYQLLKEREMKHLFKEKIGGPYEKIELRWQMLLRSHDSLAMHLLSEEGVTSVNQLSPRAKSELDKQKQHLEAEFVKLGKKRGRLEKPYIEEVQTQVDKGKVSCSFLKLGATFNFNDLQVELGFNRPKSKILIYKQVRNQLKKDMKALQELIEKEKRRK
jgi:hypothetical protein